MQQAGKNEKIVLVELTKSAPKFFSIRLEVKGKRDEAVEVKKQLKIYPPKKLHMQSFVLDCAASTRLS